MHRTAQIHEGFTVAASQQFLKRIHSHDLPLEDAPKARAVELMALVIVGWRVGSSVACASSSSEVTVRSVMPHGTMRSKSRRSVVTLSAKPCEVTPCETWIPMAPIFFS